MNSESTNKQCKHCSRQIRGRSDKQFCADACRNAYHNERNQQDNNFTRNISAILKRNRSLLKDAVSRQVTILPKSNLIEGGFNLDYHTHCQQNKKGSAIFFCFEYGFQLLSNSKIKIIHNQKS